MRDNSKTDVSHTEEFDKMYKEMVTAMEEKICTKYKHSEVKDLAVKVLKIKEEIAIPDNCEVWDDQGNVINTSKIIIREKKKEYPKTFEECCKILGLLNVDLCFNADYRSFDASKEQWKRLGLMNQFYQLLICRDAYWKIAGEEMGLGKPWEPDWNDGCYVIFTNGDGLIERDIQFGINAILAFPTEEMQDAFYENFKSEIEICKELL